MALSAEFRALLSQSKAKYSSNNTKTIKPKDGRNTYRLLVPNAEWVKNGKFWADLGLHWIKSDPDGKPLAVVGDCEVVYGQYSPINAMIQAAIAGANYNEDAKKLYESWKSRKSILVNVLDRSTNSDQPEILEITPTTFSSILEQIELYADSGVDILDPVHGMDIIITKSGKMLNTKYEVAVAPQVPGKASAPVTPAQLAACNDLQKFIADNYFRGEEEKAMNLISQFSGVVAPNAPAALGTTRTATPALTASSAVVEGAQVVQQVTQPVQAEIVQTTPVQPVQTVQQVQPVQQTAAPVQTIDGGLALSPEAERDIFNELDSMLN